MFWLNLSNAIDFEGKTLNITNGDCAVTALKRAGVQGAFLPWRDVLHIGPLLAGDLLGRFEQSRVLFLSQYFDLSKQQVEAQFYSRRELLEDLSRYDTIRLWFEYDLYDQLQLVQVLMYLGQQAVKNSQVRWVVTDHYLGPANEAEIQELLRFDQAVPESCWQLSISVWQSLIQSTPAAWLEFSKKEHPDWPFLTQALQRLQSEFPCDVSGLSLTQTYTLNALVNSALDGAELFQAYAAQEQALFLGDTVFMKGLNELVEAEVPLIHVISPHKDGFKATYEITATGLAVIEGRKNHVKLNGIDRWIGGVHLNKNNCWWFNKKMNQLVS